jgi:hypothetical protein
MSLGVVMCPQLPRGLATIGLVTWSLWDRITGVVGGIRVLIESSPACVDGRWLASLTLVARAVLLMIEAVAVVALYRGGRRASALVAAGGHWAHGHGERTHSRGVVIDLMMKDHGDAVAVGQGVDLWQVEVMINIMM